MTRIYPIQDSDGMWYAIPYDQRKLFLTTLNKYIDSKYSEEEKVKFDKKFGKYMIGDLNSISLYTEKVK